MEIIYKEETIRDRVARLGEELTRFYRGKPLTVILVMNGAFIFGADLVRRIDLECWVDSVGVSSYQGQKSSGAIAFRAPLKLPVAGRHLLLLDEVLDTGITLQALVRRFSGDGALSVKTAVLVEKDIPRPDGIAHADWCGFHVADRFLIGCGMDADEKYRNLACIAALD